MKVRSDVPSRVARIATCAALVSTVLFTGAASAGTTCETVWVESYDVSLEVGRKVYHFGDTARIDATVTRKDTGTPVAGVKFVAIVPYRDTMLLDIEETDVNGHATAELKLRRKDVQPGPANLRGIAYEEVAGNMCASVVEYGEKRIRRAFVVKP